MYMYIYLLSEAREAVCRTLCRILSQPGLGLPGPAWACLAFSHLLCLCIYFRLQFRGSLLRESQLLWVWRDVHGDHRVVSPQNWRARGRWLDWCLLLLECRLQRRALSQFVQIHFKMHQLLHKFYRWIFEVSLVVPYEHSTKAFYTIYSTKANYYNHKYMLPGTNKNAHFLQFIKFP